MANWLKLGRGALKLGGKIFKPIGNFFKKTGKWFGKKFKGLKKGLFGAGLTGVGIKGIVKNLVSGAGKAISAATKGLGKLFSRTPEEQKPTNNENQATQENQSTSQTNSTSELETEKQVNKTRQAAIENQLTDAKNDAKKLVSDKEKLLERLKEITNEREVIQNKLTKEKETLINSKDGSTTREKSNKTIIILVEHDRELTLERESIENQLRELDKEIQKNSERSAELRDQRQSLVNKINNLTTAIANAPDRIISKTEEKTKVLNTKLGKILDIALLTAAAAPLLYKYFGQSLGGLWDGIKKGFNVTTNAVGGFFSRLFSKKEESEDDEEFPEYEETEIDQEKVTNVTNIVNQAGLTAHQSPEQVKAKVNSIVKNNPSISIEEAVAEYKKNNTFDSDLVKARENVKNAKSDAIVSSSFRLLDVPRAFKNSSITGKIAANAINPATKTGKLFHYTKMDKVLGKAATKAAAKQVAKTTAKTGGKALLKRIPVVGLLAGLGFGVGRALKGDWVGATAEVASGAASLLDLVAPGAGVAAGLAIDTGLGIRDVKNALDDEKKIEAELQKKSPEEIEALKIQNEKILNAATEMQRIEDRRTKEIKTIAVTNLDKLSPSRQITMELLDEKPESKFQVSSFIPKPIQTTESEIQVPFAPKTGAGVAAGLAIDTGLGIRDVKNALDDEKKIEAELQKKSPEEIEALKIQNEKILNAATEMQRIEDRRTKEIKTIAVTNLDKLSPSRQITMELLDEKPESKFQVSSFIPKPIQTTESEIQVPFAPKTGAGVAAGLNNSELITREFNNVSKPLIRGRYNANNSKIYQNNLIDKVGIASIVNQMTSVVKPSEVISNLTLDQFKTIIRSFPMSGILMESGLGVKEAKEGDYSSAIKELGLGLSAIVDKAIPGAGNYVQVNFDRAFGIASDSQVQIARDRLETVLNNMKESQRSSATQELNSIISRNNQESIDIMLPSDSEDGTSEDNPFDVFSSVINAFLNGEGKYLSQKDKEAEFYAPMTNGVMSIEGYQKTQDENNARFLASHPNAPKYHGSPTKYNVITSDYGKRNVGVAGSSKFHRAIDIRSKAGDPIYSIADGEVVRAVTRTNGGISHIEIMQNDGYRAIYRHTYPKLKIGTKVIKGQVIGETTPKDAHSSGPHLHLEIIDKDGVTKLNPRTFLPELKLKGEIGASYKPLIADNQTSISVNNAATKSEVEGTIEASDGGGLPEDNKLQSTTYNFTQNSISAQGVPSSIKAETIEPKITAKSNDISIKKLPGTDDKINKSQEQIEEKLDKLLEANKVGLNLTSKTLAAATVAATKPTNQQGPKVSPKAIPDTRLSQAQIDNMS